MQVSERKRKKESAPSRAVRPSQALWATTKTKPIEFGLQTQCCALPPPPHSLKLLAGRDFFCHSQAAGLTHISHSSHLGAHFRPLPAKHGRLFHSLCTSGQTQTRYKQISGGAFNRAESSFWLAQEWAAGVAQPRRLTRARECFRATDRRPKRESERA